MKKYLFLLLSLFFLWTCSATTSSVVVDAWWMNSWIYGISHTVHLTWTVSWIWSWCLTNYLWTQESNPWLLAIDLVNSWTLNPSFIAPDVSVWTVMKFKLSVFVSNCTNAWTYEDITYLTIDKATMTARAWNDITVSWWNMVTLAGTWYGGYCATKFFKWYQTGTNLSTDLFDETSTWANSSWFSFTAPILTGTTTFDIALDYGCGYWTTWTDLLLLTISSWQTNPVSSYNSWWSVKFTQAVSLFSDINIKNIKLNLERNSKLELPLIELFWNSVGWEWVVQYEVQYSTGNDFKKSESKLVYDNKAYFISYDLEKKSKLWFFRVRSIYNDRYSDFSNTYSYFSDPTDLFNINMSTSSKINYADVFSSFKNLLDIFQIKCKTSCKKITF